jgi:hypothetical protein
MFRNTMVEMAGEAFLHVRASVVYEYVVDIVAGVAM